MKKSKTTSIPNQFSLSIPAEQSVKSVCIRSYSGPYFLAFGLNTERYRVSLSIQFKCRKTRTRITPNTDTSHALPWKS